MKTLDNLVIRRMYTQAARTIKEERKARVEAEARLAEACELLRCFVSDSRFQVAVGGNPNVVDRMLNSVYEFLERTTK